MRSWAPIVAEAARIAASYTTPVTLRQLHYRLVVSGVGGYRNVQNDYKTLSSKTAEARRDGTFPALSDTTRRVHRPPHWADPAAALEWLADIYRRDNTEGQVHQVWILFEKATLAAQIEAWVNPYGIPTAALRGYSSESLEREIFKEMVDDGRPVVAFYVGDLDPEGEDIERNFGAQADRMGVTFAHWERLGVIPAQVLPPARGGLGLVPNPGKTTSSRAKGFIVKYGTLFQIEAEAIDPAVLEQLVTDAVNDPAYFDVDALDESNAQEAADAERLREISDEV